MQAKRMAYGQQPTGKEIQLPRADIARVNQTRRTSEKPQTNPKTR